MEIARLVLDYLEVLVWPLVVLALGILFRRPISGFIDRIRSAKALGVEADLDAIRVVNEDPGLDDAERNRLTAAIVDQAESRLLPNRSINPHVFGEHRETWEQLLRDMDEKWSGKKTSPTKREV